MILGLIPIRSGERAHHGFLKTHPTSLLSWCLDSCDIPQQSKGGKMVQSLLHRLGPQAVKLMLIVAFCTLSDCYDPLDPNGNITVTIDIYGRTEDGYLARVTLKNYHQYRHVTKPGWKLGWTWTNKEVIWSMKGAFAIDRGNCSTYTNPIPHSCMENPTIVDFTSDVSEDSRSENCCHGGILSAWAINPLNSLSSFELKVGNLANDSLGHAPRSLTLMAPGPGYTCSPLVDTDPTTVPDFGGQRQVPAYRTWKSKCTYSSFLASKSPVCCASLSTFYNPTITSCPSCSCGCPQAEKGTETCIRPVGFSSRSNDDDDHDIMQCTDHMCPIRVHWHIKNNYRDHWRVKLTISNYLRNRNYSNWNLLVQHPGFSQPATTYSFNGTVLPTVGFQDEGVALFWGMEYYNDEIVHSDEDRLGFVSTEILLRKELHGFTLSNGWAFPRRVYFNGEDCQMPLPDSFPALPNASPLPSHSLLFFFISLLLTTLLSHFGL